jgi:hypothetical protein
VIVPLTGKRRAVAFVGLGGLVLLLGGAAYLIWIIVELNPRLVGSDAIALPAMAAIGILAMGGIVITIRLLR